MSNLILKIYDYFSKHKLLLFGLMFTCIVLLTVAASRIRFIEDISTFVPKNKDTKDINYIYKNLSSVNKMMVNIRMADSTVQIDEDLIIQVMDYLVDQLYESDSSMQYFKKIEYKANPQQTFALTQFLIQNMPYFLTDSDYQKMDSLLTEENIELQMNNNKQTIISPIGMVMKETITTDPLHWSAPVLAGLQNFQVGNQFELYNDYFFSQDRKEGIITIESQFPMSETNENAKLIHLLDESIAKTQSFFNQTVKINYLGAIDVAVTNANRIKKDVFLSTIIAVVLILCVLIYVFRNVKDLLLVFCSIVFGGLIAIGFLALLKPEVSLIAIGISSVIIGIAINYPLHFIIHKKHEANTGHVIKDIATPLLIGNITTIGAFLSLLFMSSDAMHDLGLFASLLLIGTIVFVLIFLPHLLSKTQKSSINFNESNSLLYKIFSFKPKQNKWFVLLFVVLSVFLCVLSFNTDFDGDMGKINYMTKSQREGFKKLEETTNQGQQTVYFVSEGGKIDDALVAYESSKQTLDSLKNSGVFSNVSGIGVYLPSKATQQKRIARWEQFCHKHQALLGKIDTIAVHNGFKSGTFHSFDSIVNKKYQVQDIDYFNLMIAAIANNFIISNNESSSIITILQTPSKDLDLLEKNLNSLSNHSFSFDAGTVGRSLVNTLSTDFNTVLYICGLIVFVFLLFTLGRVELALFAFLPLSVAWVWILGFMDIFGISFNIVNIILAAFIFGQGDDYTIFMTEGLMYEYTYKRKLLNSYKYSIMLSAIIMFIGIGSLIFAKHPALSSLAEITIIGMVTVVIMTFLLPPYIFRWLISSKGKRRKMPVTFINFMVFILVLLFFIFAFICSTLVGFFCFTLTKPNDKKKMFYHRFMCKSSRFVITHIPRVKTTYINTGNSSFDNPSIIVSNHQSLLDIICLMSLNPKLIILTKDWVWNSPFCGHIVRYLDCFSVSNGVDSIVDKLHPFVEKGYSILVFPEGTRSTDCSIQRFHQGAFYLAEQLKLDIVPVLLHGLGHLLPPNDIMLRKGEIHIQVMPQISPQTLGGTFLEKAKNMRHIYQKEYEKLALEVETADYYTDLVRHNYIYKGPMIEHVVKSNFKRNRNFTDLISKLSNQTQVLVVNSGYGEFPLLLSLVYKNKRVVATEKNRDCLDLAANCAAVPQNLQYVLNVSNTELEKFDAIVLIKPTEEQIKTVKDKQIKIYSID